VPIIRLPARSRRAGEELAAELGAVPEAGDGLAAELGPVPGASDEEPPAQPAATARTRRNPRARDKPARVLIGRISGRAYQREQRLVAGS
jgi:hypothetical protein